MSLPSIGEELSDQELEYYSRQIVLKDLGYEGQVALRKGKVCVVGLGGLGCLIATQLTAMGVGYLRLVDRDVVELSNLHRQFLYDVNSLGSPKVEVAAKRLKDLNPNVKIDLVPLSLNVDNAEHIIRGVDVVVDGLDAIEPRYAINRACVRLKIPYIFGAAITSYGNVSTLIPGETPCLECFVGNLSNEDLPVCAVVGVHPPVLGVVASIETTEAIRVLQGRPPRLAGKLLVYCDMEEITLDEVSISRYDNCPVCGFKPVAAPPPLERKLVDEMCGRGGKRVFIVTPKEDLKISMKKLRRLLEKRGVEITAEAEVGTTFNRDHGGVTSVLKSGIMIAQGVGSEEEMLKIYGELVVEGLGIPWSRIR